MSSRRKRRRRASTGTSSSSGQRPWEKRSVDDAAARDDASRTDAAEKLVDELLVLYASGTLTAKAVCIIAHFATEAGVEHAGLKQYAFPPGKQTGMYSRRLKKKLPLQQTAPELNALQLPMHIRNRRVSKTTLVTPLHEALEAELDRLDDANCPVEPPPENEWSDTFKRHRHRIKAGDARKVYPVALYLDGIKFTRSIGPGKGDSVLNITGYNLMTNKRHVLYVLSKREMCRCGCKGWDTLWGCFHHLRWTLSAAAEGVRPLERWDGQAWDPDSRYAPDNLASTQLKNRYVVVQIKADWQEFCASLGLPTWQSINSPCFMCNCSKPEMFNFDGFGLDDNPWGAKDANYDNTCTSCEVEVRIDNEDIRLAVLNTAQLRNKKHEGRVITVDAPHVGGGLKRGDRLVPSMALHDTAAFETQAIPFTAVFWRSHLDRKKRKMDWTHCRNPLFDFSTGISIRRTLRLDTMHCLYLGVFSFFAHAVIFAAIAENLYNVDGRKGEVEDVTCRLLFNDYKQWCLAHKIENGYQLQTLLPTMVGDDGKPFIKAKAAETGVLMRWATEFCCSGEGAKLKHGGLLSAAGVALVAYGQAEGAPIYGAVGRVPGAVGFVLEAHIYDDEDWLYIDTQIPHVGAHDVQHPTARQSSFLQHVR